MNKLMRKNLLRFSSIPEISNFKTFLKSNQSFS